MDRQKITLNNKYLSSGLREKIKVALLEAISLQELGEYPDEDLSISLFNVEISAYYECGDINSDFEIGGESGNG